MHVSNLTKGSVRMQKIGIVVENHPEYAVVEVSRKSACEGCHAAGEGCKACITFGGNREMRTRAENTLGAKVGDRVILETDSGTVILYAAAVFLLPLLLGTAGFFVGGLISGGVVQYICSLAGFVISFAFLYFGLNKRAERRSDVKIVRIVEDDNV